MLSLLMYGRNDAHGYNLHKRAAISLNCLAEVLTRPDDEILFVDYNTPADMPTFIEAIRDTLTDNALHKLRVLRVRPELHDRLYKGRTHLVAIEPISRNIAIRRANPKNNWFLSTNTDMVFVTHDRSQSMSDIVAGLPDGFYGLPRFDVPEALWEEFDRFNPTATIQFMREHGRDLRLNTIVRAHPSIRYDAPGDFQLFSRELIHSIHGFNEEMLLGWHCDSNLSRRLLLASGEIRTLEKQISGYHCNHYRVATTVHGADRPSNDLQHFFFDVSTPFLPDQAETWGLPNELVEEIDVSRTRTGAFAKALATTVGPNPGRVYDVDGTKTFGRLAYHPDHILPYVADHLSVLPRGARVAYLGPNTGTIRLLAGFLRESGRRQQLNICENFVPEKRKGDIPPEIQAASLDEMFLESDLFVADFGLEAALFPEGFPTAIVEYPPELRARLGQVAMAVDWLSRRERDSSSPNPRHRKLLSLHTSLSPFSLFISRQIVAMTTGQATDLQHGYLGSKPRNAGELPDWWVRRARVQFGYGEDNPLASLMPRPVSLPAEISMKWAERGHCYLLSGWSEPEEDGVWTDGKRAAIRIPLTTPPPGDMLITLQVVGSNVSKEAPRMDVEVEVNGQASGWLSHSFSYECGSQALIVPREIAARSLSLDLVFHLPGAHSPALLGSGMDHRELGIKLAALRFESLSRTALPLKLDLTDRPPSYAVMVKGWSHPEPSGTWTLGEEAQIELLLNAPPTDDLELAFDVQNTMLAPALPERVVVLAANGHHVEQWGFSGQQISGRRVVTIPKDVLSGGTSLRLVLRIPNPLSPHEIGIPGDIRKLGIHIRSVHVASAVPPSLPRELRLTSSEAGPWWLSSGWGDAEKEGTWTTGTKAGMSIPLPTSVESALELTVSVRMAMVTKRNPRQDIRVTANGTDVGSFQLTPRKAAGTYTVRIPAEVARKSARLEIEFVVSNPISPHALGLSNDGRTLGIQVESVRLSFAA